MVSSTPSRTKKNLSTINVAPWDYSHLSDDEVIEMKPEPTGYNSYEGSRIIQGKKYFHRQIGPDGKRVNAPKLNDEEWAHKFERFDIKVKTWNKAHTEYTTKVERLPPDFSGIDHELMDIFNNERRVLILIFRGGHKSSCGQRRIKRMILDLGYRVVYVSASSQLTEDYSLIIKEELTHNAEILRWYGYIIDDKRKNTKETMFWKSQRGSAARDPGLTIATAGGKSRIGGHPDFIILDDVVTEDVQTSPTLRQRNWRWYSKQIYPMLMGGAGLIIIGTMKDAEDLYNKILKKDTFDDHIIRAIQEWPNGGQQEAAKIGTQGKWFYTYYQPPKRKNQRKRSRARIAGVGGLVGGKVGMDTYEQLNWDEPGRTQYYIDNDPRKGLDGVRMSLQEFLLIRQNIGYEAFECEFQMNAIAVGEGYLKFDNMKYFDKQGLSFHSSRLRENCCAFFDQAFGETNRSDYNCISVVSKVEDEYYILDFWIWRGGGVMRKIEMIMEVQKKYPFIDQFGIEAGQINAEDTKTIESVLGDNINIVPIYQNRPMPTNEYGVEPTKLMITFSDDLPANKRSKAQRIVNQWTTKLSMKRVYMREGIDSEAMEEFKREASFPKCSRFDVLDSIGSCFDLCDTGGTGLLYFLKG